MGRKGKEWKVTEEAGGRTQVQGQQHLLGAGEAHAWQAWGGAAWRRCRRCRPAQTSCLSVLTACLLHTVELLTCLLDTGCPQPALCPYPLAAWRLPGGAAAPALIAGQGELRAQQAPRQGGARETVGYSEAS